MPDNTVKKKLYAQKHLPTQAKSVKVGNIVRESNAKNYEQAQKLLANNHYRNNFLIKQRMKNYQMEKDRLTGVLNDNRLLSNRDRNLLNARGHVLQSHIKYYEPIIGYQGQYTHVFFFII
jgi:hypothetical protein